MTLSTAAERLGGHQHKVQPRARRDGWPRRAANRGRAPEYLVPASLLTESTALAAEPAEPANEPGAESAELVDELRDSRDRALAALAKLTAESVALHERAARAEGEAAELREGLEHERARGDRLEAELAHLRRP